MDLQKLNSATKYPSILTYHKMGQGGRLLPEVQVQFPADEKLFLSEKVDGTNGRIIVPPEGLVGRPYLIGSREELLTAWGDLIPNPTLGIVDALTDVARHLLARQTQDVIEVYFFEIFGGELPAAKQYTDSRAVSIRLFDVARVPVSILEKPVKDIASWRDRGGQEYLDEEGLSARAAALGTPRTPGRGAALGIPAGVKEAFEWMGFYRDSACNLGGGRGKSEGLVARTGNRATIAKFRFEDYERTLRT